MINFLKRIIFVVISFCAVSCKDTSDQAYNKGDMKVAFVKQPQERLIYTYKEDSLCFVSKNAQINLLSRSNQTFHDSNLPGRRHELEIQVEDQHFRLTWSSKDPHYVVVETDSESLKIRIEGQEVDFLKL